MIDIQKKVFILSLVSFFVFFLGDCLASEIDGTIDTNPSYAFGENLGWINFACDNCDVHVSDTGLTGYVWSKQYGWINLSPDESGVTNNCLGELGGKAWSTSLGWVDFSGVTIDADGNFTGLTEGVGSRAGQINFDCDSCSVATDWVQCALRESPAQVIINSITDSTTPSISASVTITNEGSVATEYQYEWCVVSDSGNECGGEDDVYNGTGAKLINPSESWGTTLSATVSNSGNYYFKVVVYYGENSSGSSRSFSTTSESDESMGGGGGGSRIGICNGADFNKDYKVNLVDFSILLSFWKTMPPFKNSCVDINRDNQVSSIDFSIMLSQWGTTGVKF